MSLSPTNNMTDRKRRRGVSLAALGLAAVTLWLPAAPAALATDLDSLQSSTEADDNSFLRIGMSKTAVIKLPAAVRDVVVGQPAVVDVTVRNKTTAYLFGNTPGQTNVFFFDAEGREVLHLDLEVALDGKAVKKLIDRTIPGNSIQVDTAGSSVVLKGTVANASESKMAEELTAKIVGGEANIVNAMRIAEGDQVMLKVKVVEIKRDILKELGVDLSAAFSVSNFGMAIATGNPMSGSFFGANAIYRGDDVTIEGTLRAMETDGVVRILAEPNLTAVSGAAAKFHAGGEYPYTVCDAVSTNGSRYCSVYFKPYGVSLDFTPTVLSENRISLQIRTEISELGTPAASGEPTIDTRQAQTVVEIPSGGAMMLAGLIKDVTHQDLKGTPGLQRVPVLGALFRSRAYQSNQSELAVIVSPYIVNAVHESDLATPADGFNPATDRQAVLFGKLNRTYGTPGKHPNGVYHGNVGYIIE
jgi:pilus assembly protein CpaC